ncbi:MAG: hypothetical protein K2Y31_14245 [Burkholderiales bacterium]|jgi:hypothetical protein|nr:hypothetical protein [Burkholderiales bacterium]
MPHSDVQTRIRVQEIPAAVTILDAGKLLGLKSPVPVYSLLREGKLRSTIVRSKRLITGESIAELLRSGEQAVYSATRETPNKKAA